MSKAIIVIGAGGHAKVLLDTLLRSGRKIIGATDADATKHRSRILGIEVLGDDSVISGFAPRDLELVNGVGSVRAPRLRRGVYEAFSERGYTFTSVVHPSAVLGADVSFGEGVQIMAAAVIQAGSRIGTNSIVNTGAIVDHDCRIGAHVHVAPGAVLSGGVEVGEETLLGAGSTVRQGIRIGRQVIVGAGAVVVRAREDGVTAIGVPARGREK